MPPEGYQNILRIQTKNVNENHSNARDLVIVLRSGNYVNKNKINFEWKSFGFSFISQVEFNLLLSSLWKVLHCEDFCGGWFFYSL